MVRFALFGCGRIGRMHAGLVAAHPRAALVWAFDVHRPSAEAVAAGHGCKVADSVEQAMDDPAVDAVLIASSTDTHVDLITAAAKAGKAVLCEKPIDLDIARVDACWSEIGSLDPVVQIGFNRRFDPSFAAIKTAIGAGEIGEVRQVIITSRDPDIPSDDYMKVAGGLLRDMTIHDFDLARFFLGEEPVQVAAFADALIDQRVRDLGEHDTAMILLRTASGRQCCITNYRRAVYGYDQRVEVMGEHGMLQAGNRRATTVERWTKERTGALDPLLHFFIERYREAYVAEIDAFVESVAARKPVPVGFEDGRRALLLANAAYESLRSGQVVRL
ncbi:inositol 2-dehydrogenase [Geminicoccaceae bacterium 1502E]|nr:inositol 2-dehydrogenase [Geminicoccaceae bacterium 1502E]